METRVAILAILIEDDASIASVNAMLHESSEFIIGRMGLPYRVRKVNIISIMLDAPQDRINALAGRLGRLNGVTAKAVYAEKANKTN